MCENCRNNCDCHKEKNVTEQKVMEWVGYNGYADIQIKFMITVLKEIANGEYTAKELQNDIMTY